jgi:hypothetical protein
MSTDCLSLLQDRHSVRVFQDKPVPKETIEKVLEAATLSPTSHNCQEVHYVILTNKEVIKHLTELTQRQLGEGSWGDSYINYKDNSIFYSAPVVILLCVNKAVGHFSEVNAGIVSQSLMLYAHSIGLGTTCIEKQIFANFLLLDVGLCKVLNDYPEELEKVGVPRKMQTLGAIIMGFPNPEKLPKGTKRGAPKILKFVE